MIILGIVILLISCIPLTANAENINTLVYLKDGKKDAGQTKYKLDYLTIKTFENNPVRYEVTEGSNITVTDSEIITSYTFKSPNPQNPDAFTLIPVRETFLITYVDNQKLTLKNAIPSLDIYTVPPTFTETSSTTAHLNFTINLFDLI